MPQHDSLTLARWAQFSVDQQILMIGNEMNRAKRSIELRDWLSLHREYERVLRLVDLTLEVQERPNLLRELGLWRGVISELHEAAEPAMDEHLAAFRALLLLNPVAAQQIPYLLPDPPMVD